MLALKLSSAASLCTKPCKFPRSPIPSTTTAPAIPAPLSSPSSLSLVSFNVRRLAPLALHNCNPNNAPNKNNYRSEKYKTNNSIDIYRFRLGFGFRGRERSSLFFSPCFYFSSSSSSSSSSPNEPDPLSRGSGGGLVADDMNKVHDDVVWHGNGQVNGDKSAPSPSPSPSRKHQRQNPSHSKLLTLPTVLTLGRVAAVPLLVATFYVDSWWGRTATMGIFIAAAVTDWLDGYLARKMRLGSAFGAFLDPVADKLMVAASLVLLCTRPFEVSMFGHVPWLLTIPSIVIIGREITMSAVREWAASQDSTLLEAVAVNNLGKWKTATQMIALTILLATRDSSFGAPGVVAALGVALLYISAGLSVWSLSVYISKIWRVLLK